MPDYDFHDAWSVFEPERVDPPDEDRFTQYLLEVLEDANLAVQDHIKKQEPDRDFQVLQLGASLTLDFVRDKWATKLRDCSLLLLLELIIEDPQVPLTEIKEVLRALPNGLIHRLVANSIGSVRGVQAFMAIEKLYRDGLLKPDYKALRTPGGRVYLEVLHTEGVISVYLDDTFKGLPNAR